MVEEKKQEGEKEFTLEWKHINLGLNLGLIILVILFASYYYMNKEEIVTQDACKTMLESKTGFTCQCFNGTRTIMFGDLPDSLQKDVGDLCSNNKSLNNLGKINVSKFNL